MNFKRTIAKTMIFAMALSVMPLVNPGVVRADEPQDATTITFDGEAETIATNAKYWGIAKVTAENKANLKLTDAFYFVDAVESVIDGKIDVSFLKKNKEAVIAVGKTATVGADWKVQKIAPQEKDVKVLYITDNASQEQNKLGNEEGGFLVIKKGETNVNMANESEAYMIKKGKASWKTLKEFFGDALDNAKVGDKLAVLVQKGAEIKIRKKGTSTNWSSKEEKIKVAIKGKAPSVKIDPDKGTVSLKKGMDYVIPASGTSAIAEGDNWTSLTEAGKKTLKDLKLDNIGGNTKHLLVRTSASTKKLASKITDITVVGQAAPVDGKQNATATGGIVLTNIEVKTKVPYDISKGATISNNTDKDYEFYIAAQKIDNPKWTKLKAKTTKKGKKVVPTTVALKYSKEAKDYAYTSVNTDAKLFIRLAGKKQKDNVVTLASEATEIELPLKNVEQTVTLTGTAPAVASENHPKSKVTITGAKANATYKVAVKVTKIYSEKGVALKTKVTEKASGVSVKGGKFKLQPDKSYGTADLEVKTAKSFFKNKNENSAKVTVEYTVEGVKGEVEITLNRQ